MLEESGMRTGELADSSENEDMSSGGLMENMKANISKEMAGQLWQAGKQSTQRLISTYAHIDFLRPYFDIEPKEFRDRLFGAFCPRPPSYGLQEAPSELYGPLMITLSLVAVLLYGMKSSGHEIQEGTLIGTAMAICFCYWLGVSSLLFFIAYLVNSQITIIQTLSLAGYAMSGHCVVLLLSAMCDHNGMSYLFYFLWIIFGGLSGLKVVKC